MRSVQFEMTRDDWAAYSRGFYESWAKENARAWARGTAFTASLIAWILLTALHVPVSIRLAFVGTMGVSLLLLGPALLRLWWMWRQRKSTMDTQYDAFFGRRHVSLEADALRIGLDDGELRIPWHAVSIEQNASSLALLCRFDSVVVPRRAFPNDAAFDAFRDEAKKRHASGKELIADEFPQTESSAAAWWTQGKAAMHQERGRGPSSPE